VLFTLKIENFLKKYRGHGLAERTPVMLLRKPTAFNKTIPPLAGEQNRGDFFDGPLWAVR